LCHVPGQHRVVVVGEQPVVDLGLAQLGGAGEVDDVRERMSQAIGCGSLPPGTAMIRSRSGAAASRS
jgi:hypothetical protein